MHENEQKLKLTDLIDINFLQEFQDVFATTTNVASIIVDDSGSITKPSNFTDFCIKYTRGTTLGLKRCVGCDIKWGKLAAVRGEPVIYDCHTGLTDFAVPIVVDGKHIASILGGQVLTQEPNEEHFRKIARELSIDEDEYIEAVRKIKIVPEETVKAAAHLMFLVANAISEIGLKNLKLKEKNRKEVFFRLIMETVMGTLDVDETKKRVVEIIGQTLGADRCFITEYDKNTDKFLIVKDEYLSSDKIASYAGVDVNEMIPNFAQALKNGKPLTINNKEISLETKNKNFDLENVAIEKYKVNSAYALPLYYLNEFLGVFSVHYVDINRTISKEEIDLLTMISSQIAILIHQAGLYHSTRLRGDREVLYRTIMEAVRSSLDIRKTKNKIVEVICKSLNADRCFIVDYDKKSDKFLTVKDEYLSSDDVLGFKGVDVNTEIPNIAKAVKNGKNLIINDRKIYLDSDNKDFDLEKKAIEKYGVNSAFAFPLYYADELLGALAIHYVKEQHIISEDEINLFNNIANQISLAIHQSNLYDLLKQKAKDQSAILNNMPFMAWLKDYDGRLLAVNDSYAKTCNQSIKDIIGKTDFDFFPKEYAESYSLEDCQVMETKQTISSADLVVGPEGEIWHETFKSPVFDDNGNVIGTVGISQDITERKEAMSELLQKQWEINQATEREKLSRTIIEKIKSSFDVEEILSFICVETAKLFDVQRVTIAHYSTMEELDKVEIRREYKNTSEIKGLSTLDDLSRLATFWGEHLLDKTGILAFDNLEESSAPDDIKRVYGLMGVKSVIGTPVRKGDDIWGNLVLSEYEKYRDWSDEEKSLLESIAGHVYIAINQAELFEKEKKAAQKEKLIGTIMSKAISTFDINQMKQIVNDIGKITKADRCYFVEVDVDNMRGLPIDFEGEYLASDDIKSIIGYDFSNEKVAEFLDIFLNTRDLVIFDYEEIMQEQDKKYDGIKRYVTLFNLKSGIGIPFYLKGRLTAVIAIEYVNEKVLPSEEEIDFLRILANQAGLAFNQIQLFQEAKQTAEREILLREIIQALRSSLDMSQVKKNILEKICTSFNADRCYFRSYDTKAKMILRPDAEYLSSEGIESILNLEPEQEGLNYFVKEARLLKRGFYPIVVDEKFAKNTPMENYMTSLGIKADYAVPIIDREDELTWLVLHYVKEDLKLSENDKKLLETIAYQVDIAFGQIKFHNAVKKKAQREALLRDITEKIRSSLDIEETLSFICEETAKLFNVQRTAITSFPDENSYEDYTLKKEYISSPEIAGYGRTENFAQVACFWGTNLLKINKVLAFDDISKADAPDYFRNTYESMGVKSIMGTSIKRGKDLFGTIVLSEYNYYRKWTEEEKNLLNIIADQIYIAINQAELFNSAQKNAANEKALREIMLSSVSTIDIKDALNAIVTKAGELLKSDRCFFVDIDPETNLNLQVNDYAEYLSSPEIKSHISRLIGEPDVDFFANFTKQKKMSFADDAIKADLSDSTRKLIIEDLSVKSYLNVPVVYGDIIYGAIVFHYVNSYKHFTQDEIDVVQAIANQAAVVIHKAKLYKITQLQAEREKISRNIVEILRSSLDKKIIKRLFVKNIGKYFNADRVLFSDYDQNARMYSPVDEYSEYVSSTDIKSFVGYDWSCEEAREYIQPLLEKRELNIFEWQEYINKNPKSGGFVSLFEGADVKSSYNFPVLYQDKIMGFFCIEFTRETKKLSDEDISRIRSMCTQAGIALYQAELYQKVQESDRVKGEFIANISSKFREPLNNIIQFSEIVPTGQVNCEQQTEYLNTINETGKKLLSFTNYIAKVSAEDALKDENQS